MAVQGKVTLLFNFKDSGFSESYYYNATAFPLTSGDQGNIEQLVALRAQCLGASSVVAGWRFAPVLNPRGGVAVNLLQSQPPVGPSAGSNTDIVNAWLALAQVAGFGGKRQIWFRGAPALSYQLNGAGTAFVPRGPFQRAFNQFSAYLTQGLWQERLLQTLANSFATAAPVTAIAIVGNGYVQLTCAYPGTSQDNIVVSGFKKPYSYLNGTYTPKQYNLYPAQGEIVLAGQAPGSIATAFPIGIAVRKQIFSYAPITNVTLEYPGERRCGRAFFVPRGRRSGRPR